VKTKTQESNTAPVNTTHSHSTQIFTA